MVLVLEISFTAPSIFAIGWGSVVNRQDKNPASEVTG